MPKEKQTTTKRRRPASADYWSVRHPANMIRKAVRTFRYWVRRGKSHTFALTRAEECARAHGGAAEAGLARYVRGLK